MTLFSFNRGVWGDDYPYGHEPDGGSLEDHIESKGYDLKNRVVIEDEDCTAIILFHAPKKNSYIAWISIHTAIHAEVFLPDVPSMMMFLRDYLPVFGALSTSKTLERIAKLTGRSLGLQHGHPSHKTCPACEFL